jgi:hypothetical protein
MLEERLQGERPQASARLLETIVPATPPGPARGPRRQLLFAAALTATLLAALSAVGGVSYAANAVSHVASAAKHIVVTHVTVVGKGISAGGDQYKPGYGFGDPNHNHSGPPGLDNGKSGQKAPPTQTASTSDGKAKITTAEISSDEQAAIYISVLDSNGVQLLLTQKGTKIGGGNVTGPQVKTIHYVMLVPRTIPLKLRIPANLLIPGHRYTIRVIAVDPQGNKSRVDIPFTA